MFIMVNVIISVGGGLPIETSSGDVRAAVNIAADIEL